MRPKKPVWLVLFFVLWLPIQGFAAPLMLFCPHEQSVASAMPCHEQMSDADVSAPGSCDDCSFCHDCNAPTPLPSVAAVSSPMVEGGPSPATIESFHSHIPGHPRRPPRS